MTATQRQADAVRARAKQWTERATGKAVNEHNPPAAYTLALAAFQLYGKEWMFHEIERWLWPFNELREDEPFRGDEPWTVLLRRALQLSRNEATGDEAARELGGALACLLACTELNTDELDTNTIADIERAREALDKYRRAE